MLWVVGASLVFALATVFTGGTEAGAIPGFDQDRLVGGLNAPTAMDFAPDGRIFVAQQGGAARDVSAQDAPAPPIVGLDDVT